VPDVLVVTAGELRNPIAVFVRVKPGDRSFHGSPRVERWAMARIKASNVEIARVYDRPAGSGNRVLVDRLWPRGVAKKDAPVDFWLKEIAPSTELRKWYGHDPDRFDEFERRYRSELKDGDAANAIDQLRRDAGKRVVVLVTATRDVEHSGAAVLREVLLGR
jgi:uncharacterized protein YeaO (DUF488 family)